MGRLLGTIRASGRDQWLEQLGEGDPPGRLGDKARTTLGDLSAAEQKDFKALTSALSSRFGTKNRTEQFRMTLKTRSRKRDESLPELAQAIRRLTRLAYPDVPAETRGTMDQDFFGDALRDSNAK